MKKTFAIIISIILLSFSSLTVFAYDSISAETDYLKTNEGKPINLTVESGASWIVPNAGVTVIEGNNNQAHVEFSNGVSGTISANNSDIVLNKTSWFITSYGVYDTFSVSGIAPVNTGSSAISVQYKIYVTCTSSDDLNGLNNNTTDFIIINLSVNPDALFETDVTAPSLSLNGSSTVTVEAGTEYLDAGATAYDETDGDISQNIITSNPVNTFLLGNYIVSYDVTDAAGNSANTLTRNVSVVDTTAPVISVPDDISVILSGNLTSVDIGTATATDLFLKDITNNAPSEGFKVGKTQVLWTATDTSGNTASAIQNISVSYQFSGILQPINQDGSSIFKAGSSVPVKFALTNSNGNYVTNAIATLSYSKTSNNISGAIMEATSTSAATSGNLFRYDTTNNQYIFNMSTKGYSSGTYQLTITLNDGNRYFVTISLK